MPSPREQPNPRSRRRQDTMPGGWLWVVVLLLLAVVLWITVGGPSTGTLEYSDFTKLVAAHKIAKVTFHEGSRTLTADLGDAKVEDLPVSDEAKKQLSKSPKKFEVQYWEGAMPELSKLLETNNVAQKTDRDNWPLLNMFVVGFLPV